MIIELHVVISQVAVVCVCVQIFICFYRKNLMSVLHASSIRTVLGCTCTMVSQHAHTTMHGHQYYLCCAIGRVVSNFIIQGLQGKPLTVSHVTVT